MEKAYKPVPDCEALRYKGTKDKPDIKIFVSNRIDLDAQPVSDEIYIPVRCGAIYDKTEEPLMLGDDTGDNISEKRLSLCEFTVQYWAWKNVEADYYGLCHYRRFLNLSGNEYEVDPYGNIIEQFINKKSIDKYGLTRENIEKQLKDNDILIAKHLDVRKVPPRGYKTVHEQYCKSTNYLKEKDIDLIIPAIKKVCPEYLESAQSYLNGHEAYFCNMFVMKKEYFYQYCEWLYPLFDEIEKHMDTETYCEEGIRSIGHLGERLQGIFIRHLKEKAKIKELQIVLFQNPQRIDKTIEIERGTVPIAMAANNAFVAPLSVALQSIAENVSPDRKYDITILESDISKQNKKFLDSQLSAYKNINLRYYNASALLDGYKLIAHNHITKETFFRFLIQKIYPKCEKVLYLDADLVVKKDVAILYDTDVTGYMLAAVHDADVAGQVNGANPKTRGYMENTVKMKNVFDYFQAGVLLLNLNEMRKAYSLEEWLELASEDYNYSDQDVLNRYCQGKVKYLDERWNVLFDCDNMRISKVIKCAPKKVYDKYMESRKDPYIIHFAGSGKPWKTLPTDMFTDFWDVARRSPYYEVLLYNMMAEQAWNVANYHYHTCHKKIGLFGHLKNAGFKIVNVVLPYNTRRREGLKFVLRKLGLLKTGVI